MSAGQKFSNNARAKLLSFEDLGDINEDGFNTWKLTVLPGEMVKFPLLETVANFCLITLKHGNQYEIMRMYGNGNGGDVATTESLAADEALVRRAVENTSELAFSAGDDVYLSDTAATFQAVHDLVYSLEEQLMAVATEATLLDVLTALQGTITVNTGLSQPLTDTQLRTATVPISGSVTANTGLSQPLTDTQLRASAVETRTKTNLPYFSATAGALASVSTAASVLNALSVDNTALGFNVYIQIFDALVGSVTLDTTVPKQSFLVPAEGWINKEDLNLSFSIGICYAITKTATGSETVAADVVNINYRLA